MIKLILIVLIIFVYQVVGFDFNLDSFGFFDEKPPSMYNDSDLIQIAKEREAPLFTSYKILKALQKAYPGRISQLEFLDGDWSFWLEGQQFFWARGRILPPEERENWEDYLGYSFYTYSASWPEKPELKEHEVERVKNKVAEMDENPPERYPLFHTLFYRMNSYETSKANVDWVKIAGFWTQVHKDLIPLIAKIDSELQALRETDPQVKAYINGLKSMDSWYWRTISGTKTLSLHSFGIALDMVPYSFYGKQAYWRWTRDLGKEWYNIEIEDRYMPPRSFVEVFEKYGFLWGGKWFYFDTVHFEYRPEIFILNGIKYEEVLKSEEG